MEYSYLTDQTNMGSRSVKRIRHFIKMFDKYSREQFTLELERIVKKHLLHIGVNTHDILRGYATIIEHLSRYDPSFVLVHKICRIIREYVKLRPDTMRTIVNFITTERPAHDLIASSNKLALMMDEEQLRDVNDEYIIMIDENAENRWMNWMPDPYDANPRESRLFRESADVFNMLVSIYGSKDLFVKEYQQLLSERLVINGWSRHLHSEFLYLDTMKKRFTDGELNHCEVMLRDIKDSGRLASYAAQELGFPISPRIISFVYWPEISQKDNQVPFLPLIQKELDTYEGIYIKHKPARSIKWLSECGSTIEMELEIDGYKFDMNVPLIQAQILILFTEKEQYGIDELKAATGLDAVGLKRRMEWWSTKGLIRQGPLNATTLEDTFCLTDSNEEIQKLIRQHEAQNSGAMEDMMSDEEEEEQVPVEDMVEDLEQYWNYTKSLLKFRSATDPLTSNALLRLFKNFTSPGKPPPTLEAVQMFMQRKIRDNLVTLENGVFKPTKELK